MKIEPRAEFRQAAVTAYELYVSMIDAGFTEEQAMKVVLAVLTQQQKYEPAAPCVSANRRELPALVSDRHTQCPLPEGPGQCTARPSRSLLLESHQRWAELCSLPRAPVSWTVEHPPGGRGEGGLRRTQCQRARSHSNLTAVHP